MNDPPEIRELLARKDARRRRLAQLSFEEKVEILERLRELQANRGAMRSNAASVPPGGDSKSKEE
jgi:hypothetical protein